MKLFDMRPHQCEKAKEERRPLFLGAGTIEYHGEHLPLCVDTLCVLAPLDELEKRIDCVIAPPLWYGPASYAVAGPEMKSYYEDIDGAHDPFSWIRVVPLMSPAIQSEMGYDHAGKLETSLMMASVPHLVDMNMLEGDDNWFTQDATKAAVEHGRTTIAMIVEYLEELAR